MCRITRSVYTWFDLKSTTKIFLNDCFSNSINKSVCFQRQRHGLFLIRMSDASAVLNEISAQYTILFLPEHITSLPSYNNSVITQGGRVTLKSRDNHIKVAMSHSTRKMDRQFQLMSLNRAFNPQVIYHLYIELQRRSKQDNASWHCLELKQYKT